MVSVNVGAGSAYSIAFLQSLIKRDLLMIKRDLLLALRIE
jgi:hypothetical protein